MHAITLLKGDHRTVKKLFADYAACGDNAAKRKREIADRVFQAVDVHSRVEEEIFYPAVRRAIADGNIVAEAVAEHQVVKDLIAALRTLASDAEQFDAKFTVLRENIDHHVEEEEGTMFPAATNALGTELDRLGAEMAARKQQLERESIFGATVRHAKELVSKAFDALSGNGQKRASARGEKRKAAATAHRKGPGSRKIKTAANPAASSRKHATAKTHAKTTSKRVAAGGRVRAKHASGSAIASSRH